MPAKRKIVSHPAKVLREVMIDNLGNAIDREYPKIARTAAYERIRAATGISLSSLQRIMSGTTGPSIDTLADLAHHLGTQVAEILSPRRETLPHAPESESHASAQRLQRRHP